MTSTSTPGSRAILVWKFRFGKISFVTKMQKERFQGLTICLTTSADEWRSMSRLWIFIWYLSQVLEPSPQGLEEKKKRREENCRLFRVSFRFDWVRLWEKPDSRLSGGDLQDLGWHPNGTLDSEVLVLSLVDKSLADYSNEIQGPSACVHNRPP